jgi:hypothetical protein
MAKLPRDGTGHLKGSALGWALLWLGLALPASASGPPVDLIGSWHVLIHYTDDNSHDPSQLRWDDKLWVFERSGSQLRWSEYPIVVFADETGRFERRPTGQYARILHSWEPNPEQLAQIREGLEYNPRGMKSKTLRGSDAEGWRSGAAARAASASVITYTEHWSIEGMPGAPVFARKDVLGSALSENLEGLTRYATAEIEPGGDLLRGSFERDGTRHGSFRMMRAGAAGVVKGSGKTQSERFAEAFGVPLLGDASGEEALQRQIDRLLGDSDGKVSRRTRLRVRQAIYEWLVARVRRAGEDPRDHEKRLERLSLDVEKEIVNEGRSVKQVGEMIEAGELAP